MSPEQLRALANKLSAGTATPAERDAFLKAVNPQLAALIAAVEDDKRNTPPEVYAARMRRERERGQRGVRKWQRREAARPTLAKYQATLRGRTQRQRIAETQNEGRERLRAATRTDPVRRTIRLRTPRSRRLRSSRTSHGPPGRSSGDPELEPPPATLYAHAAAWRGDPRVAAWLESWGDECVEDRA